jgi:hypothetical protein
MATNRQDIDEYVQRCQQLIESSPQMDEENTKVHSEETNVTFACADAVLVSTAEKRGLETINPAEASVDHIRLE